MDLIVQYWPVLVASIMAGFVDSIGGGGGLLTVPALLNAGIPPALLLGTNKGIATFGSTAALIRYGRAGLLPKLSRLEWSLLFGSVVCVSALGAFLSSQPFIVSNLRILIPILQILVLVFLVRRWFFRNQKSSLITTQTHFTKLPPVLESHLSAATTDFSGQAQELFF